MPPMGRLKGNCWSWGPWGASLRCDGGWFGCGSLECLRPSLSVSHTGLSGPRPCVGPAQGPTVMGRGLLLLPSLSRRRGHPPGGGCRSGWRFQCSPDLCFPVGDAVGGVGSASCMMHYERSCVAVTLLRSPVEGVNSAECSVGRGRGSGSCSLVDHGFGSCDVLALGEWRSCYGPSVGCHVLAIVRCLSEVRSKCCEGVVVVVDVWLSEISNDGVPLARSSPRLPDVPPEVVVGRSLSPGFEAAGAWD